MPTPDARASASARPLASWWTATRPGVPAPETYSSRTRWPGAFGATMITSWPAGGTILPKWTLRPWAKSTAAPGARPGATSASQTSFCTWSGTSSATTCAPRTASATGRTSRPASSAAAREPLPSRRPTTTSTPESRRLSACACPWLPKPTTATVPSSRERSPSRWIVAIGSPSDEGSGTGTSAGSCTAEADAAGADELLERVDGLHRADELEDERVRAEVGDPGPEDLAQRHQLAAGARRRRHLDERELPLDRLARYELLDAEHVDELVHLLLDLLERALLAVDAQGDPGDVGTVGRGDREALDVVAATGEHAGDARERARPVLEQDAERVPHNASASASCSGEYSSTSVAAAPAGIIGKQCSRGSTRQSTTAVRPQASACESASSRRSSESTAIPTAP